MRIDGSLRPALAAYSSRQSGLVTRRQALECGYSDGELRALTSPRGPWVLLRRGVYTLRELLDCADPAGRLWLHDLAAHLAMVTPHVLSHDSAARGWGLPMLRPPVALAHITRPGVGGSRTQYGVKHHLSRVEPTGLLTVEGVSLTGLARTGLDIAREHGFHAGVVVIDAARRRGATDGEFVAELAAMTSWPFVTAARAAWAFSDAGAESLAESLGRVLVSEAGLGEVSTQFAVGVDGRVVWCDLRVGCHVIEVDGRAKYVRIEDGGLATADASEIVWREKVRERDICGEGLGMSRLVWSDFWGAARERAKARLAREYAVTEARFGPTLPEHLAAFDRQHPRPIRDR